jgi:hypothetical protein
MLASFPPETSLFISQVSPENYWYEPEREGSEQGEKREGEGEELIRK